MPLADKTSKAFPRPKEHYKLVSKWVDGFAVMESRGNEQRTKTQREFFDRPLSKPQPWQMTKKANFIPLKPMEVYHKMTPVRSIQQSINLIKALKNEETEQRLKMKPKSLVLLSSGISDNYGQIPHLREFTHHSTQRDLKYAGMMNKHSVSGRKIQREYRSYKDIRSVGMTDEDHDPRLLSAKPSRRKRSPGKRMATEMPDLARSQEL